MGVVVALTPVALQQHVIGFMNDEVMNLLHFPAFLLLALLIPKSHLLNTRAIAIWLLLPIVVELLQLWVGRTCDIVDAVWGMYALLCGFAWKKLQWYIRTIYLVPYLMAVIQYLAISVYPLGFLPLVSDMESQLLMTQINNVGEQREDTINQKWLEDKRTFVLILSKQNYPWTGIRVSYPWGINMSSYSGIKFELKTDDTPFQIDVKIAGLNNHQIETKIITTTNWTEVLIDFDKGDLSLDWSHMDHFAIYYSSENGPDNIELDNLRFY